MKSKKVSKKIKNKNQKIDSVKSNRNLHKASKEKNDEFYTRLPDIENELKNYKDHFKDKIVFCNCDDPEWSNFWHYFKLNFKHLQLKKLITTHYQQNGASYKLKMFIDDDGNEIINKTELVGNGDFRSEESIEILEEADIVVTNPPFSLFRQYIQLLINHEKLFLIIGSKNAITYKETFKLIQKDQIWLGVTSPKEFKQPDGSMKKFGNIGWYTNLTHKKRNEKIDLYKEYKGNESEYPKYENYDAIEVSKVINIPEDYEGIMGVPITFLEKYNPTQFEIIGLGISSSGLSVGVQHYKLVHKKYRKDIQKRGAVDGDLYMVVNGVVEVPYARILIKKIKDDK